MGDLPDWQTLVSTGDDDTILTTTLTHGGGLSGTLDVAAYSSVQVFVTSTTRAGQMNLNALWQNSGGLNVDSDQLLAYPAPLAVPWPSMTIPVRAPFLVLNNQGADDLAVTVLASRRTVSGLAGVGYTDRWGLSNASAAMLAGTFYTVGATPYTQGQGLHQLELVVSNSAVTGGLYLATAPGGASADTMLLADTVEGVTDAGARLVSKQVILPAALCQVLFLCRTAGTAIVAANLAALGH